jgi:uncharacterized protein (TIGR00299 family) protein
MKKVFFECVGGASGDMILAALIELGADVKKIGKSLKSLKINKNEHFEIKANKILSDGITGTRVEVLIHQHKHSHSHHHRGFNEIKAIIEQSALSDFVKKRSIAVFKRLGEAEARVHGKLLSEIHFHEVGALDSIVDIVGSCIALEELDVAEIASGSFPCGHGTINCAHGVLPNPAPAMLLLTEGHKIEYVDEPYELVTPTAAAFLTTASSENFSTSNMQLLKIGYGIGHRQLKNRPNILRATLLECIDNIKASALYEQCVLLESNIDDMTPELMGALFDKLLQEGALDVFYTPIQMKKQRPGILLTVLCKENQKQEMLKIIFTESTTLGIREHNLKRYVLPRSIVKVSTRYGKVRVKMAAFNGKISTITPEYEDCLKISKEKGVSLKKVYEAAITGISTQKLKKE